ncbi:MAG TPA: SRPBCC family protein [Baekduia sp.]|nr:SRPBCC family protein [Baekduia sp.]
MPASKRHRVLAAPVEEVWATVGDPYHLPRWWPKVARVEQVSEGAFTEVLRTAKGSTVRADFKLLELREPERIAWRQVTEGTPFERLLRHADTTIALRPVDGGTRVDLRLEQKLRGLSRFGGFMVSGAGRRVLDEALDGLEALHGRRG